MTDIKIVQSGELRKEPRLLNKYIGERVAIVDAKSKKILVLLQVLERPTTLSSEEEYTLEGTEE